MFADPQSVTYATVAKSLPAIGRIETQSTYRLNDSGVVYTLTLSHQFKNRQRSVARLVRDVIVTDPLAPAQNKAVSAACTMTIDWPNTGLSATDAQNLVNCLTGWMSSANALKLINGET